MYGSCRALRLHLHERAIAGHDEAAGGLRPPSAIAVEPEKGEVDIRLGAAEQHVLQSSELLAGGFVVGVRGYRFGALGAVLFVVPPVASGDIAGKPPRT